jgi:hypothetical protein
MQNLHFSSSEIMPVMNAIGDVCGSIFNKVLTIDLHKWLLLP